MNKSISHLIFRLCTFSDLDALVRISRETFVTAFENDNDPADFKAYIDQAFSKEQLQKELHQPDSQFHFVFWDNTLVGYFKLNSGQAQTDIKDKSSVELERIYVLAEHQGKGIGAKILEQVIAMAQKNELDYVWLGVWEHNPNAIRFYKRYGFTKFGTHPYFIGKDKQTDWLLRLDL
ncbi:GNAT family N-acetyltransferase [Flagellimonas myxillae]|uniref:GNAT family N-acetyltransferase n=1 Tax=Flagellimonas myxillae TaxID=2942214 RepID=UPI00201F4DB3|nr:GNAT family N-acetyltransferase [Muricauda myxillae]MCL6266739.1 GNAT family N-acetyltransferase [Muricauda myxillae]